MNKTAIKNFAIWARRKLISDITYKAGMLGVSEKGIAQPLPHSTKDLQFFDIGTKDYTEVSGVAIEQRNALIAAIQAKEHGTDYKTAFQNVVEEVAYTWFNRLIAVRFMEINDYLPSHIRVLSSENEGKLEPDFVTNPFDTDLAFSVAERDRIIQLKDENRLDELFRMLFIKQCNKLSEILPGLFEKISDYTELLLNISFTDKDGIIYHLTHDISEDEFNVEKEGQVEIIGWMYQYYNTEPKDEVFSLLKKNVKITKERIPAATQLFTPDWIVRYMVENSLGRLWVEGHPNDNLKENWKYYLEEAEQEPDVVEQLKKIREEYALLDPTDIKVIDPCMGSGHILVYAFDVLMQIYKSQGYVERDAAKSILINNLYGIDIDTRAYQLAYFAVMMKARQYNRKIFQENITPNLIAIRNPENVSKSVLKRLSGLEPVGLRLVEDFEDAEEYGSILQVSYAADELDRIEKKLTEIEQEAQYGNLLVQMEAAECVRLVKPLLKQARLLAQKYEVVVTNPPYMGSTGMTDILVNYLKGHYPNTRSDLCTVFMEQSFHLLLTHGFMAMINTPAWMTMSSFEKLRKELTDCHTFINMAHFGRGVFGADFGSTSFVIRNSHLEDYNAVFLRLFERFGLVDSLEEKESWFIERKGLHYSKSSDYRRIPGYPIAYWISEAVLNIFSLPRHVYDYGKALQGTITGDNERFLRLWFEVSFISFTDKGEIGKKWYAHNKGGNYRKWYGNREYVINWENDGYEIKNYKDNNGKLRSRPQNIEAFFHQGISWSDLTAGKFSARYYPDGSTFDATGPTLPVNDNEKLKYLLGYFNTNVFQMLLDISCPGIHYNNGIITNLPVNYDPVYLDSVIEKVTQCISDVKEDWDSFEISWDFKEHPFVWYSRGLWDSTRMMANLSYHYGDIPEVKSRMEICWLLWKGECEKRFNDLKTNEEELNRIFIDIYGLQDELTPEVADKDVTVRKADLGRDIRSFISYAVGCMFGRYSLDVPGLVYAGGEWDASKYMTFIPDADNCIPITDTEYFQDDIVGRFVEFIRAVYGAETLEENLEFIASALGNKGSDPRKVIRNYFLNDFYKDHLKIYQKRPIYWLFDSGKQNGFKALVYMHRWNADTVGNMRVEYLHKMQNVYEHEIDSCQDMIEHGSGHDVAVATKRKEKLVKQMKECKDYDALVAHIAFSKIDIDLDDGVKMNYRKVQTGSDGKFCEILADSKDIMAKEK